MKLRPATPVKTKTWIPSVNEGFMWEGKCYVRLAITASAGAAIANRRDSSDWFMALNDTGLIVVFSPTNVVDHEYTKCPMVFESD